MILKIYGVAKDDLFQGQKQKCYLCQQPFKNKKHATRDHIVPRALGGSGGCFNILLACLECNREKADNPPTEAQVKRAVWVRIGVVAYLLSLPGKERKSMVRWRQHVEQG